MQVANLLTCFDENDYTSIVCLCIQSVIRDVTRLNAFVASVDGADVCEVTPCMPTPCKNRGVCSLDELSVGGYVCSCPTGYTGTKCEEDVLECAECECTEYYIQ